MEKMSGIIFSNVYDSEYGELTADRTVASMHFGGRYRLIDFVLSSMVNSGITEIGVITKYNYESLIDHLGNCEEWDLNRKNSGLSIIPPFAFGMGKVYNGKLEALFYALKYLRHQKNEYVLISESINVCNIDFSAVLKSHIASGKDVTAIASKLDGILENAKAVFTFEENGELGSILVNCKARAGSIAGLGMYVMKREKLISAVESCVNAGFYHFEKDFLQKGFNKGELGINVYNFQGVVLRNTGIQSFWENNLRLTDEKIREGIFLKDSPITTRVRDEIPSFYGDDCSVFDCIIADGSTIDGEAEKSIIFRNVKIEAGAKIKNSVIMQGTRISKDAYLENVIIDTDVTVTEGQRLIGSKRAPVIIKKGETV